MKKLIAITMAGLSLIAVTATSYGQGEIVFQNNTSQSAVTFGNGVDAGDRVFDPAGTITYGFYIGAAGLTAATPTLLLSQLTLIDTVGNPNSTLNSFTAGAIGGGTVGVQNSVATGQGNDNNTFTLVGGTTYTVEVAAWETSEGSTFAAASAADNGTGFFGVDGPAQVTAEASPNTPNQLFGPVATANQLSGFTISTIPEPATLALGGLGAAADRKSVV